MVRWLAPSLTFTCEEAWKAIGNSTSIHLQDFLKTNEKFKNNAIEIKWEKIKNIRRVITGALEIKRADKTIGSSLESHLEIYLSKEYKKYSNNIDLSEIAITSSAKIFEFKENSPGFKINEIDGISVDIKKAEGSKCHRCWKFNKEINSNNICNRCEKVIKK
tara:strand:- start:121 stop:606 length:486 start_codon:yes stop_codon:yes gene_type:complete